MTTTQTNKTTGKKKEFGNERLNGKLRQIVKSKERKEKIQKRKRETTNERVRRERK
jgi:hypothetical protein